MSTKVFIELPVPLSCANCGSTAQVHLDNSHTSANKSITEFRCGCGAKIIVNAQITSIEYYSKGPHPTLLKRI